MKSFSMIISTLVILFASQNTIAGETDEFECKKPITNLSVVYYGDEPVDVVIYDKKKKGSVIQIINGLEKGDVIDVNGLEDTKKEILWELYEIGTDNKVAESLFLLDCKDEKMDELEDCGNTLGDGKKEDEDDEYFNGWLFNGLSDKKGNSFRCNLPETQLIPPTITLLGSEQIAIEIGDDFIDPGAVAADNTDGDLTSIITTQTDLDILAVGAYTITYSVTDFDGNTATASRIVTVSDEQLKVRVKQTKVAIHSDDAEQNAVGIMYRYSTDLELAVDPGSLQTNTVGIRFTNLSIPENFVITKSYIQFTADEVSSDNADLTIYAEKNSNAYTFNEILFNISSRTKTDASVAWSPAPWNAMGESSEAQRTPDLTPIIQEIRSEFGELNSVAFIVEGTGTRTADAYDGEPNNAPVLYVEYLGGTVIETISVAPQIKQMLSVNSSIYEVVNQPDQGSIQINAETGDFAYKSNANPIGNDLIKFKSIDSQTEYASLVLNIEFNPAPVLLNGAELSDFSSNLPLLIIDTNNNTIVVDPKIKGVLTIIPPDTSGRSSLTSTPEYSDFMEIDYRGSSSLAFPKKGYGVDTEELVFEDGEFSMENNDVSLLGMPEEHKWVLHGPYSDKSLMRNYIAYNKTRDMGGYAAVRSKYVEVLVREGSAYRYDGIYVFMEKIVRDKNRVDIKKLDSDDTTEPDISGGYILKQDRVQEDWSFNTNLKDSTIVMEYPDSDDLNDQQKIYIQGFINGFEAALFAGDYNDPESSNYYENFIEPDSFVKHLLSRELFRDVDAWQLSEFFSKEREGKLSMLPVWDFNLGMGNAYYGYAGSTQGWDFDGRSSGTGGWMNRLMDDSKFSNSVRDKWLALRSGPWSDDNLNGFIDDTKNLLQESQGRNFERWPVLGRYIWPNRRACDDEMAFCDTWDKAVEEHLRAWIMARAAWMDANIPE